MEPQFTPGPWAVSKRSRRKVTNAHGVVICNAVLRNQGGPKHKTCLKSEHEAEANAQIIAAAPSLLAALESAPIIGRAELWQDFRDRQDRWLRETYNPAINLAKGA